MAVTNQAMLEAVASALPNMTDTSAKQTAADWMKNPGKMFQDNNNTNFLNTLATFVLQRIRVQDFYNPLEESDVISRQSQPYANIQRLYTPDLPSVDADFQAKWTDGAGSDMWKKRTIKPTQKFAFSNISYSNRITIPGAVFYTSTFNSYNGLVDWDAALTQTLLTTYSKWRFALFLDIIGRQTEAENLQDTQEIVVSFGDVNNPKISEIAKLCEAIENMESYARISAKGFNEDKFMYSVNPSDIRYLCKVGFKNACRYALAQGNSGSFSINPERINRVLDKFIEVPYLGVPTYYQDEAHTTKLYPVYDANGMITGLNTQEDGGGTAVALDAAHVVADTSNINVLAIDKNRISYVTAVTADGQSTELQIDYTIYNIEGDYRNMYSRVLGNPSEGSGARLFADTSYLLVKFINAAE